MPRRYNVQRNPPISKRWPVIYDCNNTRAVVHNHNLILNDFDL